MIDLSERQLLLEIARVAVVATVTGEAHPTPTATGILGASGAAFVSLHLRGQLRGCMGRLEDDGPLVQIVADCARLACTRDPRFPAVTAVELDLLDIEISVLGAFEPVASLDDIEIGRHGLLIEHRRRRGLLLPQVATEWRWNPSMFVENTCLKAGLPADSWQRGALLWRFEAEVFGKR